MRKQKMVRIIEYVGPTDWIEATLKNSFVRLGRPFKMGENFGIQELSCTIEDIPDEK